ncbi:MAG: diacylglycerol kinase [Pseudomonadota bacterium]
MPPQKPTGLIRVIKATGYSLAGIKAAFKHETAFRQELCVIVLLFPLGLFFGQTGVERALLIVPLMIVLVTELLNSAIEAIVDRVGSEYHALSKQAKDLGSAAVFISIATVIIVWTLILI